MNIVGRGARAGIWQVDPYIHWPHLIRTPYIRQLTDECKSFIVFTTTCFGCLPRWGASKIGKLYNNMTHNNDIYDTTSISHTYDQIHNIVYHNISSNPQYSLPQAKQVQQLYSSWWAKLKEKLQQEKAKNDYIAASLPSDPPIGLKRVSTKSYPCPPPCDPEVPWKTCKWTC
jgi:hypothetical protein